MSVLMNMYVQADRTMRQSKGLLLERLRLDSKFHVFQVLLQTWSNEMFTVSG